MRKNILDEIPEEHESYGMLGFSRTSVNPPIALFGSSIKHGNIICMIVKEAKISRNYQKNWIHGGKNLIEIEMSASQFAEAISSMNIGDGIPVTVKYVKGDEQKREPPPEKDFKKTAQGELKSEMKEIGERIEELSKDAKEILERKGTQIKAGEKEKLLRDIMFLLQEVRSNIPFAHECFQEAVDKTVTEAKVEIDTCFTTMREKIGQKALDGKIEIPLLEDKNENL